MDQKILGITIKELREAYRLDQDEVAAWFNLKGYQQVSKWETGKLYPSVNQLVYMSERFRYNLFNAVADPCPETRKIYYELLDSIKRGFTSLADPSKTIGDEVASRDPSILKDSRDDVHPRGDKTKETRRIDKPGKKNRTRN